MLDAGGSTNLYLLVVLVLKFYLNFVHIFTSIPKLLDQIPTKSRQNTGHRQVNIQMIQMSNPPSNYQPEAPQLRCARPQAKMQLFHGQIIEFTDGSMVNQWFSML